MFISENAMNNLQFLGLNQQDKIKDEIRVPSKVICHLIGTGGETLRQIQQQSSCTVQIQPPGPDPALDRPVTLSGTRASIEMCRRYINQIIEDNPVSTPSPPINFSNLGSPGDLQSLQNLLQKTSISQITMESLESEEIMIPQNKVGLIIGRGGESIKDLQNKANCRMQMIQEGKYANASEKPLKMIGTPQAIIKAKELVNELLKDDVIGRMNGSAFVSLLNSSNYESTQHVNVPKDLVGMVIGRDGQTIRKIQNETGAKVQFNTVDPNVPGDRYVLVQGTREQVDRAVYQVNQICEKAISKESRFGPGTIITELNIPANKCGLVIGKGGETIKSFIEQSGAHIELNKNNPPDALLKAFTVRGTQPQIELAQQLICQRIGINNVYISGTYDMNGQTTQDFENYRSQQLRSSPQFNSPPQSQSQQHGGLQSAMSSKANNNCESSSEYQLYTQLAQLFQQQQQLQQQQQAQHEQQTTNYQAQQQQAAQAAQQQQTNVQTTEQQLYQLFTSISSIYGQDAAQLWWQSQQGNLKQLSAAAAGNSNMSGLNTGSGERMNGSSSGGMAGALSNNMSNLQSAFTASGMSNMSNMTGGLNSGLNSAMGGGMNGGMSSAGMNGGMSNSPMNGGMSNSPMNGGMSNSGLGNLGMSNVGLGNSGGMSSSAMSSAISGLSSLSLPINSMSNLTSMSNLSNMGSMGNPQTGLPSGSVSPMNMRQQSPPQATTTPSSSSS